MEVFKNVGEVFFGNEGLDSKEVALINSLSDDAITLISMNCSDDLTICFESGIEIFIRAQNCCENRYMHCEDEGDFDFHKGAFLRFVQIVDGEDEESSYGHETKFCNILTSKGVIQLVCHSEHNGYYGGICVQDKEK